MAYQGTLTRREAVEAIVGTAVVSMVPAAAHAERIATGSGVRTQHAEAEQDLVAFSDLWRFHRGDVPGAEAASFSDSAWRIVDAPHDWSIEDVPGPGIDAVWSQGTDPIRTGPFDMYASEGQTATGWTVGGVGWYRKTFKSPAAGLLPSEKAELRFESVYMNSDVWINGVHLGKQPYGYTEFAYDITPHLKSENTVAVRVDNTGRNSRWYSGSGMNRKVWLSIVGELRIPAHGVYVTTTEASPDAALVNFEVTVENGGTAAREGPGQSAADDGDRSCRR